MRVIALSLLILTTPAFSQSTVKPRTTAFFLQQGITYQAGFIGAFFDNNFSHTSYSSREDVNHFAECISGPQAPNNGQIMDAVRSVVNADPALYPQPAVVTIWVTLYKMCGKPPSMR